MSLFTLENTTLFTDIIAAIALIGVFVLTVLILIGAYRNVRDSL